MIAPKSEPAVSNLLNAFKLDRSVMQVFKVGEEPKPWEESAHRSHAERMMVLEALRQNAYGYEACSRRLARVLEVAQRNED